MMNHKIKSLVLIALLSSLIIVAKESIAFLPNIELVTFLFIVYTLLLPLKTTLSIALIFCTMQMLLYGIETWTPMYYIVWPSYVCITYLLKNKLNTDFKKALLSAYFGLIFGLLFSIPYAIIDPQLGLSYYINGIFFDLIHGVSNYFIMIFLFQPTYTILKRLLKAYLQN